MKFILSCLIVIYSLTAFGKPAGELVHINEYLRNMKSVSIDFIQEDSKGYHASGTLLIDKPFNFRCNYYGSYPLLILGNKHYLTVYDYDMETTTRINPKENMFNFLLMDEQDFSKHFSFNSVDESSETLSVDLIHKDSGKKLVIIFDKLNKQINQITIFEVDNIITLNFEKAKIVKKFDESLFILKNTKIFGPPKRLTKTELDKKLEYAR